MRIIPRLFFLCASTALLGCVNTATSTVAPGTDLFALKKMYVKQNPDDKRGVGMLVVNKLNTKGVVTTIGVGEPQVKVDALVSYKDVWVWDLSSYMVDLTILVKDPKTEQVLANGNSRHGSLTRLTPQEMVSEVVDNIYGTNGSAAAVTTLVNPSTLNAGDQAPESQAQRLRNLKRLFDQGLISKSEYEKKKSDILSNM